MSQPLRLVETSPNPPARAEVVVIGGGIILLQRRGGFAKPTSWQQVSAATPPRWLTVDKSES